MVSVDIGRGASGVLMLPLEKLITFPGAALDFSIKHGGSVGTLGLSVRGGRLVCLIARGGCFISRPRGGSLCRVNYIIHIGRILHISGRLAGILIRNLCHTQRATFASLGSYCITDIRGLRSGPVLGHRICVRALLHGVRTRFMGCIRSNPSIAPSVPLIIRSDGSLNFIYSAVTSKVGAPFSSGRCVLRRDSIVGHTGILVRLLGGRARVGRVSGGVGTGAHTTVSRGRGRCCLHRRVGTVGSRLCNFSRDSRVRRCRAGVSSLSTSTSIGRGLRSRIFGLSGVPRNSRRNAIRHNCLSAYVRLP